MRNGVCFACYLLASALGCGPETTEETGKAEPSEETSFSSSLEPRDEDAPRRDILGTEEKRYSQHDEELIIRDFFQDRRNGFFLDVGCAWPVVSSNTYYLEEELGWKGFGVDALIDHEPRWLKRRPKSKFFNYIVTDHSGTVESFYKTERGDLIGISTVTPGLGPAGNEVDFEEVKVPTITLTELLDRNGVEKVDLLSMDIEGAEPEALAGFDIDRFHPELAVVEAKVMNRDIIVKYFTDHGYEWLEQYDDIDPANYYFAPAESAP